MQPGTLYCGNWVKVVTYICAHGHTHSRNAWAENIANVWLPYTNMGKLQSAITLIQRHESIPAVNFLVLIHSACPYKNYVLKCSQPNELDYLVRKTKKLSKIHHSTARFTALSDPIPSLAVLHTEKQAFQCAALQSWELCLGIWLQCSYMHSRAIQCKYAPYIAILSKSGKGRHVHMCAWA